MCILARRLATVSVVGNLTINLLPTNHFDPWRYARGAARPAPGLASTDDYGDVCNIAEDLTHVCLDYVRAVGAQQLSPPLGCRPRQTTVVTGRLPELSLAVEDFAARERTAEFTPS